jgi:hypothetical protein
MLTVGIVLAGAGSAAATTPPTPPPVAATTLPATSVATPPPAGSRGGATEGSVVKPSDETWSPRRIATMTALAIVALAAAGYAYGKMRSAPPRHPDLAPRPPDLDGADQVEAAG